MKILYVSPQHVTGTLSIWAEEHRRRGNECRYVTLFPTLFGFEEDICMHLPLHPDNRMILQARQILYRITRGRLGENTPIEEKPPFWKPESPLDSLFFKLRDALIAPKVARIIREFDLNSFDIIHLDQGAGFFRDARVVRQWHKLGKKLVAFYHGSDMRNRGILKNVDECVDLRLTSEIDLTYIDPRLEYLFLPFDTSRWTPRPRKPRRILKIVHAARVRSFKGTDHIIRVVEDLRRQYPVELVLIENAPHFKAMAMKADCDIAIDQIADSGGWGYGMSSVEYLSLGIPTCTSMRPEVVEFLPDHPFVPTTADSLREKLVQLIENEGHRHSKGEEGREWVVKHHDVRNVGDQLYSYYKRENWLKQ